MMKISFRAKMQAIFTLITNGNLPGFFTGKIYQGSLKSACVPGLNCYSCPGALFSCPLGSLQNSFASVSDKVSYYVLGSILGFGAMFGRLICGYMCPFGFLQDLIYIIKLPFVKKRLSLPFHKILKYMRYLVLAIFVLVMPILLVDEFGFSSPYFCKLICPSGTFFAAIPLLSTNVGLRASIGGLFFNKITILLSVLFLSVKYYRPFCKYICPLGAIYGVFNPIALYRFEVDKDKCTSCKSCQRVCPMEIKAYQTPNSPDCIRCGKCLKSCKFDALNTYYPLKGLIKKQERKNVS